LRVSKDCVTFSICTIFFMTGLLQELP